MNHVPAAKTHGSELCRLPIILALLVCVAATRAQTPPPIDLWQAKAAFSEAEAVSDKEGGVLWGRKLYGAMFFVDPDTRFVVSNQSDPDGVLQAQNGLYVGTLPRDIIVSNAPLDWQGRRWTMLMWPTIPTDEATRRITFAHELFHRIQPDLGLMAQDSPNPQLDTFEGRVWLQLEWRALAAALSAQGAAQATAIRDALAFRNHRHALFPGCDETEASLEIAEGIPEFTGVVAGEPDRGSARWRAIEKLVDPDKGGTFVRSFAYTSGPPYGLLLDARLPRWRVGLSPHSDLGMLLASTLTRMPVASDTHVDARAALYGSAALRSAERERDQRIEAVKTLYRARLIEGRTLFLPGGKKFSFSFNPSALVALDGAGTVYPTFHAVGEWGTLDVTDGVLVPTNFSSATVAAPEDTTGLHLKGPGWTLDLVSGWHVVPGDKSGNYVVRRE